jgi:hypothetical protein
VDVPTALLVVEDHQALGVRSVLSEPRPLSVKGPLMVAAGLGTDVFGLAGLRLVQIEQPVELAALAPPPPRRGIPCPLQSADP